MFLSYALLAYLIAYLNIVLRLFIDSKIANIVVVFFSALGLGLNIHELAIRYVSTGQFQSATRFDFIILLSIAFTVIFLIFAYKYKRIMLGLFILPFSILFSALSVFTPMTEPSTIVFSIWRYGHLPLVILGSVLFILSFLSAMMYLILEYDLRRKRFGVFYKILPPLDTLNRINNSSMRYGFYLFSIGSIIGVFWVLQIISISEVQLSLNIFASIESIKKAFPNLFTFKIVLSTITWIYYGIIIAIKAKYGLPPKKLAVFTIVGFASVIVTYLGVGVFLIW